jgi:predicted nucleic acid-binding protein
MSAKPFLDTNILVYAFAAGDARSERAEAILTTGGVVSVQVLNEFTNVMRRKLGREWDDVLAALDVLRAPRAAAPAHDRHPRGCSAPRARPRPVLLRRVDRRRGAGGQVPPSFE